MRKKLYVIAGIVAFCCSVASASSLTSYDQITSELAAGKNVLLSISPEKCKVSSTNSGRIKRLALKFTDLYEVETEANDGKKMRAIAIQETGLFGNKKFGWYRTFTLIFEDNTVKVYDDTVDPSSFNLSGREIISCKLTADNSGGVTAIQLSK